MTDELRDKRGQNSLAYPSTGPPHAESVGSEKYVEAESTARECYACLGKLEPDAWSRFAQALLGATLLGQKKYAAAEPLLIAVIEG